LENSRTEKRIGVMPVRRKELNKRVSALDSSGGHDRYHRVGRRKGARVLNSKKQGKGEKNKF